MLTATKFEAKLGDIVTPYLNRLGLAHLVVFTQGT